MYIFAEKSQILFLKVMFIEFSVGNFRSFKDIQTISMLAPDTSSDTSPEKRIIPTSTGIHLLKSKAIYGANADGKSNLIKAFISFGRIIGESLKDDKILSKTIQPFALSTETEHEPSFFQMIFLLDDVQYRYGFEATKTRITAEWLLAKKLTGKRSREIPLFTREGAEIIAHEKQFREGRILLRQENDLLTDNALFLRVAASFKSSIISRQIVDYIEQSMYIIPGDESIQLHPLALAMLENPEMTAEMLKMLTIADIDIEQLGYDVLHKSEFPENVISWGIGESGQARFATSSHTKYNASGKAVDTVAFMLSLDESNGTKKMFEMSPILITVLKQQALLVIDELDARWHPRLTRKVIELFNSPENKGAQLLFVTHDTTLLEGELLRHDQVSFVEKDRFGASTLYSLSEFKGVRKDAAIAREYMRGRYGAVPRVGDFTAMLDKKLNGMEA